MPQPQLTPYVHTDGRTLCLGKRPPKVDPRTLKLAKYTTQLPAPPISCDWTQGVTTFGQMLNQKLGDCVCAMVGHGVQIATLNSPDNEVTPPDSTIEQLYEQSCGYIPGDPRTDQGCFLIDTLNWVRQNQPWLHKDHPVHHHPYELLIYVDPDPQDIRHVKQAIANFGVVGIGLNLPLSAQSSIGKVWEVVAGPTGVSGSWGGHAMVVCKYDEDTVTGVTWGALQTMSWDFFKTYSDEAHALLYRAWVERFAAQSSDVLTQMEADLALVVG